METSILSPQMDLLDVAGQMLEKHDFEDVLAPGLLEMTGVSQHGMATASGLNDYDYQTLSSLSMGHKTLNQVQTINKISIPPEILEHFKHIKCHCMMGLFPEINRAWLTIDSEIYIWTYEQARDVAYYDGLNHLIVSVGLVKPRPGVFINDVKYLLILTTPIEIIILGVTFGDTTKIISSPARSAQNTATFQEMQLMNKPVFILATDNVSINVIQGSDNGRVFLGGRDGCLYEISYKAESNWFGKRCRKINHSQSIVSYMVPSFLKVFSETDPIVRLAVDDSRKFLYVLTEKGSIEAWDMGEDSNSMRRIAKITQNEIVHASANIIKTVDSSVFKIIKAICPLTDDDCPNLHLMAVTQCGIRLYFSTTPLTSTSMQNPQQQGQSTIRTTQLTGTGQLQSQKQQQQPTKFATTSTLNSSATMSRSSCPSEQKHTQMGLYLLHIRLPPGYTPNTTTNKPKEVHSAHYSDKTLLLVSTPQHDQDILWSISSAPFPYRPYLTESTTVMPMDGIVWCMAETSNRCKSRLKSVLRKAYKPKKIVLLTNQGAHIIAILKPIDLLQQLLMACHGPHHEAIKAFFQAQGEKEACTTALLLACSEQYRGTDLAMWAAQAFMLYGGEPTFSNQMQWNVSEGLGQSRNLQSVMGRGQPLKDFEQQQQLRQSPQMLMSTPIANSPSGVAFNRIYQQHHQQTPLQSGLQQTQFPLSPITNQTLRASSGRGVGGMTSTHDLTTITYSAKHNGLYLYVARLVRPIWKMRCIDVNLNSTITQEDCIIILEDLHAIRNFLEANAVHEVSYSTKSSYKDQKLLSNECNFGMSNIKPNEHHTIQQLNVAEQAQTEEKRSLIALNFFIKHTSEVISLWKILCEHRFSVLVSQLQKEQQRTLASCTFRDLILSRSDTCALLIVALINSYLKDTASVSSISTKLRDVCPNLYRHEDAVSFKATEILMNAKNCTLADERDSMLRTALQLCKDAAPNLPLQNLCQQFTLSGFYEGVIELTSTCASKIDPEEFAIHYHQNDEPEEDRDGYSAYAARMACYKEVRNMLDHIYQSICTENANKDFPKQRDNCADNVNEFNKQAQMTNIIKMALRNKDPLLHMCVYSWLLSHDMLAELLCISEPSLGEFLKRNVLRNGDNLKLIDLLWKYYEKNGYHYKAARILDHLASIQSDNISLDQRIEHLARAVMCMRNDNVGYSITDGVLLKELEDKLEIARIQKTVLDAISVVALSNMEAKTAVKDLNRTLYDITQLYELFAEPFHLWECKLTILKCSHHNDPLLIESVWGEIINKAAAAPSSSTDGTESGSECCTRLFSKMENLFKEFGESGHCFPLSFIIRELEVKACQLHLPEGIVPEKLLSMNIDVELLMEYYSRMISINERVWANEGNEWHLVQSSIAVVNHLANNSHTLWSRSKRRIIGKAQDMVSVCLNLCYQKPGTERMQHTLKELQFRLQRALA